MFLRSCDRRRTDEADQLKALSAGADDYICKPFGLVELAIRIELVWRRMRPVTSSGIVFDRFSASGSNTQRSHYQVNQGKRILTFTQNMLQLNTTKFQCSLL